MRSGNLFWGVVLVVVGGVLVLNNLGVISVNIWSLIWPTFIILLGVSILLGSTRGWTSREVEEVDIPLEGTRQARIRLQHGAGRINLRAGASRDLLLRGSFAGGLNVDRRGTGESLEVTLQPPTPSFPSVMLPWAWGGFNWTIQLNPDIPLSMELNTGAGDTQLDLTDLLVTDLVIKTGASLTDVNLPARAGHTRVKVEGGANSVILKIPKGVAARIESRGGLSATNIDQTRFPRSGAYYESNNFESAENKIDIRAEIGVGSLEIR